VPVRRTIEALGLAFDRSGNRIVTQIGSKTVVLTIGAQSRRSIPASSRWKDRCWRSRTCSTFRCALHRHSGRPGAFRPAHQYGHDRRPARGTLQSRLGSGRKRLERFGTVEAVDVLSDPPTLTLDITAASRRSKSAPMRHRRRGRQRGRDLTRRARRRRRATSRESRYARTAAVERIVDEFARETVASWQLPAISSCSTTVR